MATTRFQAEVLKLIASSRIAKGASYIAGGLALNHQLKQSRLSSDIDIFNNFHKGTLCGAWPTVVEPAPEGESV